MISFVVIGNNNVFYKNGENNVFMYFLHADSLLSKLCNIVKVYT